MKKNIWVLVFCFLGIPYAHSAIVYQDFEQDNGTPQSYSAPAGSNAEYGWGFNGAVVELNDAKRHVHSGVKSWKITIPAGEHVHAGSAVPAQVQTYQVNFVPQCHDRLTFWIWADPSAVGDHTAMVKFFDQGAYKQEGTGIWTLEPARYRQWTQLTILFSQLPKDFNLNRVDKIEFFNYWDGTYYYDDIEISSAQSAVEDVECLKKEQYLSCLDNKEISEDKENLISVNEVNPILGLNAQQSALCRSIFSSQSHHEINRMLVRLHIKEQGLRLIQDNEPR